jgi:hypothetical protein
LGITLLEKASIDELSNLLPLGFYIRYPNVSKRDTPFRCFASLHP